MTMTLPPNELSHDPAAPHSTQRNYHVPADVQTRSEPLTTVQQIDRLVSKR
jgi:hypothetical protein